MRGYKKKKLHHDEKREISISCYHRRIVTQIRYTHAYMQIHTHIDTYKGTMQLCN